MDGGKDWEIILEWQKVWFGKYANYNYYYGLIP